MPGGIQFFSSRWVQCRNVGTQAIPAHGVVEIDDISIGDGSPHDSPLVFDVKRPTADNKTPLAVNGPMEIPAPPDSGVYCSGYAIFDGLAMVSNAALSETVKNLGATQDSFDPLAEGIGMRVLANSGSNFLVSLSSPDFGNLPVVNEPEYAIALDSNGCLCKTPVNPC